MTDNIILNWFLSAALALLVLVIAVGLVAYCIWDLWGRYKHVVRRWEKERRGR